MKCQSSDTNLIYMRWFIDTHDGDGREIYYYDYFFNPVDSGGVGDYINHTESIIEGPSNENITLIITDATIVYDDGTYYCMVQPLAGVDVESNRVNVSIYGE